MLASGRTFQNISWKSHLLLARLSHAWPPAPCNSIPMASHTLSSQDAGIKNTKDFGFAETHIKCQALTPSVLTLKERFCSRRQAPTAPCAYVLPLRRGPSAGQGVPASWGGCSSLTQRQDGGQGCAGDTEAALPGLWEPRLTAPPLRSIPREGGGPHELTRVRRLQT